MSINMDFENKIKQEKKKRVRVPKKSMTQIKFS